MKIQQIVPNEHENKDKTLSIYFLQLRNLKKRNFLNSVSTLKETNVKLYVRNLISDIIQCLNVSNDFHNMKTLTFFFQIITHY